MWDLWMALLVSAAAIAEEPAPPVSAVAIPTTEFYAGMPPTRFQRTRMMNVSFGTLARCGTPAHGVFVGCIRSGLVHMPDPCDFGDEFFARTLCHEMAHLNGWPGTHGE